MTDLTQEAQGIAGQANDRMIDNWIAQRHCGGEALSDDEFKIANDAGQKLLADLIETGDQHIL
jgi:hypothetical protein